MFVFEREWYELLSKIRNPKFGLFLSQFLNFRLIFEKQELKYLNGDGGCSDKHFYIFYRKITMLYFCLFLQYISFVVHRKRKSHWKFLQISMINQRTWQSQGTSSSLIRRQKLGKHIYCHFGRISALLIYILIFLKKANAVIKKDRENVRILS